MRKGLNFLLAVITMLLIALVVFVSLNGDYNFIDISSYTGILTYIFVYGPIGLAALFAFVNIIGKGILRLFFTILTILLIAAYVITMFFPTIITNIFPIV